MCYSPFKLAMALLRFTALTNRAGMPLFGVLGVAGMHRRRSRVTALCT